MGNNLNQEEQEILNQGKTRRNRKEPELPNFGSPVQTDSDPSEDVLKSIQSKFLTQAQQNALALGTHAEKYGSLIDPATVHQRAKVAGLQKATMILAESALTDFYALQYLRDMEALEEKIDNVGTDPNVFEALVTEITNKVILPHNDQKALTGDLLGL